MHHHWITTIAIWGSRHILMDISYPFVCSQALSFKSLGIEMRRKLRKSIWKFTLEKYISNTYIPLVLNLTKIVPNNDFFQGIKKAKELKSVTVTSITQGADQERTKWRKCRLTTKNPDYQLGWAILADCRHLDTHKRNFCFMYWKFSQPYLLDNFRST